MSKKKIIGACICTVIGLGAFLPDDSALCSKTYAAQYAYVDNGSEQNNLGVDCFKREDYNNGLLYFSKAISLSSNNAIYYTNRGETYLYLKKYDAAISDFSKAISLGEESWYTYYNRGLAYHKINKVSLAIDDYSKVIELNPKYQYAYHNRAAMYSRTKEYKKSA